MSQKINKHIFDLLVELGYAQAMCKRLAVMNGKIIERKR